MLITVLASSLIGTLSGLGVGGGSLMMLWLTFVCGQDPVTAKQINLLFYLPAAAVSTMINARREIFRYSEVFPAAACGSISAAFFSAVSKSWDAISLRKWFGIILCVAAIRELCFQKYETKR